MAITINATPKDYAPVYNKMEYLLTSTNFAQTNFSYLVDIYINGAVTKTARLRIPKRPSDDKGLVDIHRILEATLTFDVGDTASILGNNDASNSSLTYIVKFGEEYGTTVTQYPDLTVDSTRYAINASLERQEFIDWNIADYLPISPSSKFLTNAPLSQNLSIDDHGWLYHRASGVLTKYTVTTYNSLGVIGTWSLDTPATATIQYVASAPVSLNLIDNSDLLVGTQPIITTDTEYYTITGAGTGTPIETRTFVIKEPCKFNSNRLIFQNKLGGFDGYTFYNGDSSTYNIERKTMKVNVDNVSGTSIVYSMSDRDKVQYYTKTTETIKLMSDWLSEAEDAWLLELIESPVIYLQNGNDLIAVSNIKATSHTKKKVAREKLFRLDVELELGYDNYRQRG